MALLHGYPCLSSCIVYGPILIIPSLSYDLVFCLWTHFMNIPGVSYDLMYVPWRNSGHPISLM